MTHNSHWELGGILNSGTSHYSLINYLITSEDPEAQIGLCHLSKLTNTPLPFDLWVSVRNSAYYP